MCKLKSFFATTIFVWLVSTPFTAQTFMNADRSVENARLVCDEFGRCWQINQHLMLRDIPIQDMGTGIDL